MNAKFKKLAIQAGVAAVMAGGSLSAHAVITAVPAPAQLIPLFFHDTANSLDVEARVIVPRAVGVDSVIQLLGGTSQASYMAPSVQPGLTVPANANSRIHWVFLNVRSEEVVNSSFPVTPDDEVYFSAANMPCAERSLVNGNNVCTVQPTIPDGQPGYLVMVNESAVTGNAGALFSFSAEAWLANEAGAGVNGLPTAAVIPVLGLADTADTTEYPTPTNNVIESGVDIIASPIHTGMRTSTTLAGMNSRVFDIPMQPTTGLANGAYLNTIIAWADRNYAAAVANPPAAEIKNGLSGAIWTFNNNEVGISNGKLTLPNQLNIVPVWRANAPIPAGYAFSNIYSQANASSLASGGPGNVGLSKVDFTNLANGGFLKFAVDTVTLPNGGNVAPGAYSSVVIFTIPTSLNPPQNADDDAELAIDTGFFTDK